MGVLAVVALVGAWSRCSRCSCWCRWRSPGSADDGGERAFVSHAGHRRARRRDEPVRAALPARTAAARRLPAGQPHLGAAACVRRAAAAAGAAGLERDRRVLRGDVAASPPPAPRCSAGSTTCRCRSTCGAACCSWSAGWASSCWWWRCCRCWASVARSCSAPRPPGPMKDQKLTPRIAETARGLWSVYFGIGAGVLSRLSLGRHELGRRLHAHVHHRRPGRLLVARRRLRALELADDRGGGGGVHGAGRRQLRAVLRGAAQSLARACCGATPRCAPTSRCWSLRGARSSLLYLHVHGTYDDLRATLRHAAFHVVSVATTTGLRIDGLRAVADVRAGC